MRTSTLMLGIALNATPADIFHALTDSARHSRFTGGASAIEPREGGAFSYFGGAVSGVFGEVSPARIVQRLRAANWPEGHTATLEQTLEPQADGQRTFVRVREEDVPVDFLDDVIAGWSTYWEKLSAYLRERRVAIVERFVDRYKNHQEWDVVDEFITEDCDVHIPLPGLPQGREGMRLNGCLMCTAFPDVHVTREFFVTEGDIVIERAHAMATHRGELIGTAATGRPVTWTELHAYRVRDDRICEVWSEADFMGVMIQIGAAGIPRVE